MKSIAALAYEIMREGYSKNINEGEIMVAVKDYINKLFKDKLYELYAQSNTNPISKKENHTDCYSLGDKEKEELLNDNAAIAFAQNLAYGYLIKAAHCLKKVSMKTNDRRKVLLLLRDAISIIINNIQTTNFNFSILQIERVITVSMELLFHRIVMMYKNNILSNNDLATGCLTYFASFIYSNELNYIKDNWTLKDAYSYSCTNSHNQLRDYLDKFVKSDFFTQEQVNNAFKKSYIDYLEKEIQRLILADKDIDTQTLDTNEIRKEEDHTNCYILGDKEKEELLNDNAAINLAHNLAYRYLMKAAHCLKKVSMQANDRRNVLLLLRNATSRVINDFQTTNFNFSIPQIERVITVSMELLFHRIVMLYKNNILSNNDWSTECINYFATSIYFEELKFIKNNWALEGTYQYTNTNSNNDFREYLYTFVKSNFFTQKQVNNAFKKSYIDYLGKEIQRLILTDKNNDTE